MNVDFEDVGFELFCRFRGEQVRQVEHPLARGDKRSP